MTQKKVDSAWVTIAVIAMILFVIFAGIAIFKAPKEVVPEGYLSPSEVNSEVNSAVNNATSAKDSQIAILQQQILDSRNQTTETEIEGEVDVVYDGYLIDELYLSVPLNEDIFSDREINLFDGEVKFDGDNYDAEETLVLEKIVLKANENDYEGNVYMNVPSGAIEYKLTFDNELNTSLIDEDDTLEFNFLGVSYEVSNWNNDSEIMKLH